MTNLYKNKIIECSSEFLIYKLQKVKHITLLAEKTISYIDKGELDGSVIEDFQTSVEYSEENMFKSYMQLFNDDNSVIFADTNLILDIFKKSPKKREVLFNFIALRYSINDVPKEYGLIKIKDIINQKPKIFKDFKNDGYYDENEILKNIQDIEYTDYFFLPLQKEVLNFVATKSEKIKEKDNGWIYLAAIDFIIDSLVKEHILEYNKIKNELKEIISELSPEFKNKKKYNLDELEFNLS